MARRGSVYCMANDEMPRIVKIGATLRSPEERLNDARSTTWAPTCYRIIAHALVEDAFAAEQALHTLLAHRRLEARREFFRIPHAEARALFAAIRAIAQLTDDDSALGRDDGIGTDEGGASAIDPLAPLAQCSARVAFCRGWSHEWAALRYGARQAPSVGRVQVHAPAAAREGRWY